MDANTPWDHVDINYLKEATGLKDLMETANPAISPRRPLMTEVMTKKVT